MYNPTNLRFPLFGYPHFASRLFRGKDAFAMHKTLTKAPFHRALILGITVLLSGGLSGTPAALAASAGAASFATPEQAVDAFVAAARANDAAALVKIFGPDGQKIVNSGDPIADREARARFVAHYGQGHKIVGDGKVPGTKAPDTKIWATLVIGPEEWPFPIPLVHKGSAWQFDVEAGTQEILNRRIGRNELNAIEVCRSYAQAQRDYAADLAAEHRPLEYAQKFVSSPGLHDGLYWPAGQGEKESPIGPLMASARAEGYGPQGDGAGGHTAGATQHAPYHGYRYAILTRQGPAAPGGARDYVVDGHMVKGFALIAFPATYGDSGVMTFIVNQDGIVYQKDLGPHTATIALSIKAFDPDKSWRTP